jgi:hypothetical protein
MDKTLVELVWEGSNTQHQRQKEWDGYNLYQSQWPLHLRYEMFSPARKLGSWVRIPLEAWMSVRVSAVFMLSDVGSGLAMN